MCQRGPSISTRCSTRCRPASARRFARVWIRRRSQPPEDVLSWPDAWPTGSAVGTAERPDALPAAGPAVGTAERPVACVGSDWGGACCLGSGWLDPGWLGAGWLGAGWLDPGWLGVGCDGPGWLVG